MLGLLGYLLPAELGGLLEGLERLERRGACWLVGVPFACEVHRLVRGGQADPAKRKILNLNGL